MANTASASAVQQPNLDYSDASSPRAATTGFSIEPARKKRGRPRKYSPDGNIALGLSPTPVTPISSVVPTNTDSGGGGDVEGTSSENPSKKARGRPPSSSKKQLDALGIYTVYYCCCCNLSFDLFGKKNTVFLGFLNFFLLFSLLAVSDSWDS